MKLVLAILALCTSSCTSFGPITATDAPIGSKLGTACNTWILAPVLHLSWGRNDIRAAALNGKISKIAIVDSETRWYLLYGETCTNVYGE